jgi:hypothetical protein
MKMKHQLIQAASELNERLRQIERGLVREARIIGEALSSRVLDNQDWLSDYEVELRIEYYLRESDPAYREDDDNILATYRDSLKFPRRENYRPLADGRDWNEFQDWSRARHSFWHQHHCWLFHCLYDHELLSWEDIARIGIIWTDLKVIMQHAYEHPNETHYWDKPYPHVRQEYLR